MRSRSRPSTLFAITLLVAALAACGAPPASVPEEPPPPTPAFDGDPLPNGTFVASIPQTTAKDAIGFWPPMTYGGWDDAGGGRYELVVETREELIVLDGRSSEVSATLPRPDVSQINAVLVTGDSVWVTDHDAGAVLRLDRETGRTIARIEIGGRAVSLLETAEGIWAGSAHRHPESVVLIDPATNIAGRRIEAGAFPGYGAGALWFGLDASGSTASGIRRVDPLTGEVQSTIDARPADGCYVGGAFPEAVWSFCFLPPPTGTRAGRLDLNAMKMTTTVKLGGAGSLIGVADGNAWFLVEETTQMPARLIGVNIETNEANAVFRVDTPAPPFDRAAVIGDSVWIIDVVAGQLRQIRLEDMNLQGAP